MVNSPPLGVELYDHRGDTGDIDWAGENVNVAADPAHAAVIAELRPRLLVYIQLKE
jgi:hypothetical protein